MDDWMVAGPSVYPKLRIFIEDDDRGEDDYEDGHIYGSPSVT